MTDTKVDISKVNHIVRIEDEVETTIDLDYLFLSEDNLFIRRNKIVLFFRLFVDELIVIIDIVFLETNRRGEFIKEKGKVSRGKETSSLGVIFSPLVNKFIYLPRQ